MSQKSVPAPAATAPELPGSLKLAADKVGAAVTARRHVEDVLTVALKSLEAALCGKAEVRAALAEAETAAALANTEVDRALQRRHIVSRDAIEICEVRVQGLQDKRADALRAENEARIELSRQFIAWKREQHAAIRAGLEAAIKVLVGDVRLAYAAAVAVGDNRTISCIANMQVSVPGDQHNLCNPQRLSWKNDPAAIEAHARLASVCAAVAAMLGELAEAATAVTVEQVDAA
jgi:hypothetical protein